MTRWIGLVALLVIPGLAPAAFVYECSSIESPFSAATAIQNDAFTLIPTAFCLLRSDTFSVSTGGFLSCEGNGMLSAFYSLGTGAGRNRGLYAAPFETAAWLPEIILIETWEPTDTIAASLPYSQKITVDHGLLWRAMHPIN